MNRNVLIGIGILVIVILGFMFFSNMTGNVITGSVVAEKVENEYFRIDDFGSELNEVEGLDGIQDSSGSG